MQEREAPAESRVSTSTIVGLVAVIAILAVVLAILVATRLRS